MKTIDKRVEAAVSAIEDEGLAGFPVGAGPNGKAPWTPNGFHAATTDPAAARRMFEGHADKSHLRLGVVPGKCRVPMIVLDFDLYKEDPATLRFQEMVEVEDRGELPPMWRHETPSGGLHYVYLAQDLPADLRALNGEIAPGVDIRCERGYVIWPTAADPVYKRVFKAELDDDLYCTRLPEAVLRRWVDEGKKMLRKARKDALRTARPELSDEQVDSRSRGATTEDCLALLAAGAVGSFHDALLHLCRLAHKSSVRDGHGPLTLSAWEDMLRDPIAECLRSVGERRRSELQRRLDAGEVRRVWEWTAANVGADLAAADEAFSDALRSVLARIRAGDDADTRPEDMPFVDIAPIARGDQVNPRWIIPGVLERGAVCGVAGDSNVGKTRLEIALCLALAGSADALGEQWLPSTHLLRAPRVAIVNNEETGAGMARRLHGAMRHHGADTREVMVYAKRGFRLAAEGEARRQWVVSQAAIDLAAWCVREGIDVLVLDPLVTMGAPGMEENNAGDMGFLMGAMRLIASEADLAVMFVHHSAKASEADTDPFRGSGAIRSSLDIGLSMRRLELRDGKGKVIRPHEQTPAVAQRLRRLVRLDVSKTREADVEILPTLYAIESVPVSVIDDNGRKLPDGSTGVLMRLADEDAARKWAGLELSAEEIEAVTPDGVDEGIARCLSAALEHQDKIRRSLTLSEIKVYLWSALKVLYGIGGDPTGKTLSKLQRGAFFAWMTDAEAPSVRDIEKNLSVIMRWVPAKKTHQSFDLELRVPEEVSARLEEQVRVILRGTVRGDE